MVDRSSSPAIFAVAMATLIVAHTQLPAGPFRGVAYVAVELASGAAALAATRLHRPRHPTPWWLLGGALLVSGATSTAWYAVEAAGGDPTVVSPAYLLAFVLALAAVWSIIRVRSPHAGLAVVLDTAIVTTGASVLLWVAVIQPAWGTAGGGLPRLLVAIYPLFGLAMLAALTRLAFGGGRPVVSFRWLVAGVGIYLGVHIVETLPTTPPTTVLEVLRLVGTAAFGISALHPSMRAISEPTPRDTITLSRWRLAALWVASVAAPLTLLWQVGSGEDAVIAVTAVGSIALFTLVVARLWGLLRTLREVLARQHEDRFRALVEHAEEVVLIVHPEDGLLYASPSAQRVWGHSIDTLRELGPEIIAIEDRTRLMAALADAAARPADATVHVEGRLLHADGGWRDLSVTLTNHVQDPAIGGVVVTCRDVTEQRELDRQLTHQAFHDPLTGLPNRALFTDRAVQALEARTEDDRFTAVLFLDLDDFKAVNDVLGHDAGDDLLRVVAQRLADAVRPEDTVARFGGDEFAVLLPRVPEMGVVTMLAERLLTAVARPIALDRRRVEQSASLGIATSHDGPTAEALLRDADAAMYAAKQGGKGGFQLFDPAMHAEALRRLQLTSELRTAIGREELAVVYQTIHQLSDEQVVGMEALLRWTHPTHGPIRPDEFIPLAEASGSIVPIGAFVLDRACDEIVHFRARTGRDVFVTVNVSAVQLTPALVEVVRTTLQRTQLPPARLVLELTESVFIAEDDQVADTLRSLSQIGVQLAIDDFGTGYCSLAYLDRIRFDLVKVDRSFVATLDDPHGNRRLTTGILDLIDSLGVPAVAEGVETRQQAGALRTDGCVYGQGYHWSRPVPMHELLATLPGQTG